MRSRPKQTILMTLIVSMMISSGVVAQAGEWKETIDGWRYEENGVYVQSEWKKGEKGYYYLDENRKLLTASWAESGDNHYYVDSEGLRLGSQWIQTKSWDEPENSEEYWYYLDANGKMLTGKQKIGDKTYFFTEEGRMLTGWVDYTYGKAEQLDGEITHDNISYCEEDGSRLKGWKLLPPPGDVEAVAEEYWYHFDKTVRRNCKKKIGDLEYCFDESGKMIDGWSYRRADDNKYVKVDDDTDPSTLSEFGGNLGRYLYGGEDGGIKKNTWLKILPPGKGGDSDDGTEWFYFDSKGKPVFAEEASPSNATPSDATASNATNSNTLLVRKIKAKGDYAVKDGANDLLSGCLRMVDGKQFLFGKNGQIITGVCWVYNENGSHAWKEGYYNFDSNKGRMTGKVTLEDSGYYYDYYFAKDGGAGYSKGQGVTGIFDGKLWFEGLLVKAEEGSEYELVSIPKLAGKSGTGLFLVDESGKVKKSGRTPELLSGTRYRVQSQKNSKNTGYLIYAVNENQQAGELTEFLDQSRADRVLEFDDPADMPD